MTPPTPPLFPYVPVFSLTIQRYYLAIRENLTNSILVGRGRTKPCFLKGGKGETGNLREITEPHGGSELEELFGAQAGRG